MNTPKKRKLQYLLISQLLEQGSVKLVLPDGITLEIGILQEDEDGELQKAEDYCYVVATRGDRSTILDSFNLGLQYQSTGDNIVCEDEAVDDNGRLMRTLDVV